MSDSVSRILGVLALLGVVLLGAAQWSVNSRLATLEGRIEAIGTLDRPEPLVLGTPTRARKAPEATKVQRGFEKLVRRAGRRKQVRERVHELKAAVHGFMEEHGFDATTEQAVLEELQLARESMQLVRSDMQSGSVGQREGRTELQELRTDTDAALAELIGEEAATELMSRLGTYMEARKEAK